MPKEKKLNLSIIPKFLMILGFIVFIYGLYDFLGTCITCSLVFPLFFTYTGVAMIFIGLLGIIFFKYKHRKK